MNNLRLALGKGSVSMRWMARLASVVISDVFLLILFLVLTNEDRPREAAIPLLVVLVLTIAGCFLAWRWEKIGGVVVVIGALCLSVAAYMSSLTFGLGSRSFLVSLIYGIPFLVVGILFWASGQSAPSRTEKH